MRFAMETTLIEADSVKKTKNLKRPPEASPDNECEKQRPKLEQSGTGESDPEERGVTHAHSSPKKRLEWKVKPTRPQQQYIYGNYNQYYGYRNNDKDFHARLALFESQREFFKQKQVLDIGCNSGQLTMAVAKKFPLKSIVGIDIDRSLINQANKALVRLKKAEPAPNGSMKRRETFPFNTSFVHGNYVLSDDVLLEIETPQFDVILCLSVTKWIHLNFGDAGLKQAFRRMYAQLRSGGRLILEAQPYDNYGRRKKMTENIFAHYKAMKFFPKDFTEYLQSDSVGFCSVQLMGIPENCKTGFKRPIQIFQKV